MLAQSRSDRLGASDGFTLVWPGALAPRRRRQSPPPLPEQFFSYEQIRTMCRGEGNEPAQFRTGAAYALLAGSYRAVADVPAGPRRRYLHRDADRPEDRTCARSVPSDAEVADAIAEELSARTGSPEGGIGEVVRDVLRARFACF